MRRIVLVVLAATALAGCGLLDGILGTKAVSAQQLCADLNTQQQEASKCPGQTQAFPSLCGTPNDVECLTGSTQFSACQNLLDELLDCIEVKQHSCSDLTPSTANAGAGEGEGEGEGEGSKQKTPPAFCASEFDQFESCSNFDGCDKSNNNGGPICAPDQTACGNVCCNQGQACVGPSQCQTTGPTCATTNCGDPAQFTCVDGPSGAQCLSLSCLAICPSCTDQACCSQPQCQSTCSPCSGSTTGSCNVGDAACCPACQACPPSPTPSQCSDSHLEGCPGCGPASCNNDTICEVSENAATCNSDCGGLNCTPGDATCEASEDLRCGDCSQACSTDGDCAGGFVCDDINDFFCNQPPPENANCNAALPKTKVCLEQCATSQQCNDGRRTMCITAAIGARRDCEAPVCHANGECPAVLSLCVAPTEMQQLAGGGVCLQPCDPIACQSNPATCACQGFAGRCATVRDASGAPLDYACVPGGTVGESGACTVESDCANGLTCFSGQCVPYCSNPGGTCASPPGVACQVLTTAPAVGVCHN